MPSRVLRKPSFQARHTGDRGGGHCDSTHVDNPRRHRHGYARLYVAGAGARQISSLDARTDIFSLGKLLEVTLKQTKSTNAFALRVRFVRFAKRRPRRTCLTATPAHQRWRKTFRDTWMEGPFRHIARIYGADTEILLPLSSSHLADYSVLTDASIVCLLRPFLNLKEFFLLL